MNALALTIMASSAALGAYVGARVAHRTRAPRMSTTRRPDSAPDEDMSSVAFDWAERNGRPDVAVLLASKLTTVRRVHRRRQIGRLR